MHIRFNVHNALLELLFWFAFEVTLYLMLAELFYTERAHVRMLKVLDSVFYQKLTRDNILPPADIKNIFTNLEEIVQLHSMFSSNHFLFR